MAESVAELRRRYVSGCHRGKWREGVLEGRNPGGPLSDSVNIRNFDRDKQNRFNNRWIQGALSPDSYRKYLENTSNKSWKWAQNFGDADNWDL